jgi:hypothetical protein
MGIIEQVVERERIAIYLPKHASISQKQPLCPISLRVVTGVADTKRLSHLTHSLGFPWKTVLHSNVWNEVRKMISTSIRYTRRL